VQIPPSRKGPAFLFGVLKGGDEMTRKLKVDLVMLPLAAIVGFVLFYAVTKHIGAGFIGAGIFFVSMFVGTR
jgi:hypothetical protein